MLAHYHRLGGEVTSFVVLLLSAMEFHEHLQSIGTKEGLKERKLQKAVESFTWNITILKVLPSRFGRPEFAALSACCFPLLCILFPALCVTSPSRLQCRHGSPVRTLLSGESAARLLCRRLMGRKGVEWLARCGACQEGKGPCVSPLKHCRLHSCQSLHWKQH